MLNEKIGQLVELAESLDPHVAGIIVLIEPHEDQPKGVVEVVTKLPRAFLNSLLSEYIVSEHGDGF